MRAPRGPREGRIDVHATGDHGSRLTDTTQHRALRADIARRLASVSLDTLRVVDEVLLRLEKGRSEYGELELATSSKDWQRERLEELLDVAVYNAIIAIKRRDGERVALYEAVAAERLVELHGDDGVVYPAVELGTSRTPIENFDFSDLEDTIPGCEIGGEG